MKLEIPWQELTDDALCGLIEEFITREGTDYGDAEYSLMDKVAQVRMQLQRGDAVILFDSFLESATLVTRQEAKRRLREQDAEDSCC